MKKNIKTIGIIIILKMVIQNVSALYLSIKPEIKKKKIYKNLIITRFNNITQISFYISKNTTFLIPVYALKNQVKINFFKSKFLFKKIRNFTGKYNNEKITSKEQKIQSLNHALSYSYMTHNEINTVKQNNEKIYRALNFYFQKNIRIIKVKVKESGYIKISYPSRKLIIPAAIFSPYLKSVIRLNVILIAGFTVRNALINKEYAKRVYCGEKNVQGFTTTRFPNLEKIFPVIRNRVLNLTRFNIELIPAFMNKDLILNPAGLCPLVFNKDVLVKIITGQNFSVTRKLILTKILLNNINTYNAKSYLFKLWSRGSLKTRFVPVHRIQKRKIFNAILPEIDILNRVSRYFKISKWILYKHKGVTLLRMISPVWGNNIRILFTKKKNKSALKLLLYGYFNVAQKDFKNGFLVYSNRARVIVIKNTNSGLFALDFNSYRDESGDLKYLSLYRRKTMIKKFKNALTKIK